MKQWIYIVAYKVKGQDAIAFRHINVTAKTKDSAYTVGMQKLDDKVMGVGIKLLNNYVVPAIVEKLYKKGK